MIAVLAAAAVALPALAGNVTVGRFYTELAKAKHLGAVDATSAEANLRSAGFRLPSLSLDKTLTEGDVAAISTSLGLSVTTTRPTAVVSDSQMGQFVGSYGTQLGGTSFKLDPKTPGTGITPDDVIGDPGNSGNGKGNKKGHNKSTSEPQ
jgi:hypothetical protein